MQSTLIPKIARAATVGLIALVIAAPAFPRGGGHGGGHSGGHHSGHSSYPAGYSHHGGHAATGVPRDTNGRIARSSQARNDFKRSSPCPATGSSSSACPGYVIDHVTPLKRGGADHPSNLQWQTTEAARAKDRIE